MEEKAENRVILPARENEKNLGKSEVSSIWSAPSRTRTYNLMIKSHLLYQLSYRGEAGRDSSEFDFGCHFAEEFFPVVDVESSCRSGVVEKVTRLTSLADLDRVCRSLASCGRRSGLA